MQLLKVNKPIDRLCKICDRSNNPFSDSIHKDSSAAVKEIIDWAYKYPAEFFTCLNVRGLRALGIKRKIWLVTSLQGTQIDSISRIIADQILNAIRKLDKI